MKKLIAFLIVVVVVIVAFWFYNHRGKLSLGVDLYRSRADTIEEINNREFLARIARCDNRHFWCSLNPFRSGTQCDNQWRTCVYGSGAFQQ